MEGNLPAGSKIQGTSYGVLDLQGNLHMHQQQQHQQLLNQSQQQGSMFHPAMNMSFPPPIQNLQESDRQAGLPLMDYNKKVARPKISTSDDDEPSMTEDLFDDHNELDKGKKGFQWHRMKWTNAMIKLLITAVSYVGEDVASECHDGGKRKHMILQKKGKWRAISKVLAERGCYVSPQQCEDKFNDLNKRYKRLTDILGRGTSCKVVENPELLDRMPHISDKLKDDARKILSSKHLFYEEMCSYHNRNRLNLPADPALQRSLQLALKNRDDHDSRDLHEDVDEDDHSADSDGEEDNALEYNALQGHACAAKRMKDSPHEEFGLGSAAGMTDCDRTFQAQGLQVGMNPAFPGPKPTLTQQNLMMTSHSLHLEEKRLHIQGQLLELEKQRFKWQRFSNKKDRELNRMKMENERMRIENEQLALELRQKELEIGQYPKRNQ